MPDLLLGSSILHSQKAESRIGEIISLCLEISLDFFGHPSEIFQTFLETLLQIIHMPLEKFF